MVKKLIYAEFLDTTLFFLFTSFRYVLYWKFWFCWPLNNRALQYSIVKPFLELLYTVFLLILHLFITSKLMVSKSNISDSLFLQVSLPKCPIGISGNMLSFPRSAPCLCSLPRWTTLHLLNPFAWNWEVHLENDGQRTVNFQIHGKPRLYYMLYSLLLANISFDSRENDLVNFTCSNQACLLHSLWKEGYTESRHALGWSSRVSTSLTVQATFPLTPPFLTRLLE